MLGLSLVIFSSYFGMRAEQILEPPTSLSTMLENLLAPVYNATVKRWAHGARS